MDFIIATMTLGVIAKILETKLEKTFEKEWIDVKEIPVQEKLGFEAYS